MLPLLRNGLMGAALFSGACSSDDDGGGGAPVLVQGLKRVESRLLSVRQTTATGRR